MIPASTPTSILAKMRNAILVFCGVMLLASPSNATIVVGIYFGNVYNAGGSSLVEDGTLWALVADSTADGVFAGFGEDQRLSSTATADTFFDVNQRINVGSTLNGDTVIAMGGFNANDYGLGNMYHTLELSDSYAGQSVAFYWFPGAVYTGGAGPSIASYTGTSGGGGLGDEIGNQVGGVNTTFDDTGSGGTVAMVLGAAGTTMGSIGMATIDSATGVGSTAEDYLYSVNLTAIPEPSSALLAVFGSLLLLRRRRSA